VSTMATLAGGVASSTSTTIPSTSTSSIKSVVTTSSAKYTSANATSTYGYATGSSSYYGPMFSANAASGEQQKDLGLAIGGIAALVMAAL
jgi:hypothetical protein